MNKLILTTLLSITTSLFVIQLKAQGVTQVRAQLDKINRRVHIYYNLLVKKGKYDKYEVDLYLSQDSGKTFTDRLELVGGNVGKGVIPGIDKKIEWYYTKELPQFDGQNVAFKVRAKVDLQAREKRILALKGPEAAGFSLLFPGWGDYKVRSGKNYWWLGISAYGLAGSGIFLRNKSNTNFDAYLTAESISQADELFKRADQQRQISTYLLATAAAIWISDITGVIIKGVQNKKEQQRIHSGSISANPTIQYNTFSRTPQFGISMKW